VTWATSVPILVFLGLSVLDLGPMYATDRRQTDVKQTDVRQKHHLMSPATRGGGIITAVVKTVQITYHKQTCCRRAAATICPALSSPVGAEAPRAAEQTAT